MVTLLLRFGLASSKTLGLGNSCCGIYQGLLMLLGLLRPAAAVDCQQQTGKSRSRQAAKGAENPCCCCCLMCWGQHVTG